MVTKITLVNDEWSGTQQGRPLAPLHFAELPLNYETRG